MSRALKTQDTNPGLRGRDPGYHYVRVEIPTERTDDLCVGLEAYTDPNDGGRVPMPVYEEVTRNREVTGSSRMALLRTPIEGFKQYQSDLDEYSTRNLKPRKTEEQERGDYIIGSFTEFDDGKGNTTTV